MSRFLEQIVKGKSFAKVAADCQKEQTMLLSGLSGTQKSLLVAALYSQRPQQILIISYNDSQSFRMSLDLQSLLGESKVAYFPCNELLPHEESFEPEVTAERLETLNRILSGEPLIVVTSWKALHRKIDSPERLREFSLKLNVGSEYNQDVLLRQLVNGGYERVDLVQALGQFSHRGDIVDVFPLDTDIPYRIEFFGDEIDSIRRFKPETQISEENAEFASIMPARESLWSEAEFAAAKDRITADLARQIHCLEENGQVNEAERLRQRIEEILERLESGHQVPEANQFLPWIVDNLVTLFEYMPNCRIVLDEPVRGLSSYNAQTNEIAEIMANFLEKGVILPEENKIFMESGELENKIIAHSPLMLSQLEKIPDDFKVEKTCEINWRVPPEFYGKGEIFCEQLEHLLREGYRVILAVSSHDKALRLHEALGNQGVSAKIVSEGTDISKLLPQTAWIIISDFESGVDCPQEKLMLLCETEIYGRQKKRYATRFRHEGTKINSFTDLKEGDYVVHLNHGIGKFVGIETLEINGGHRDYLRIEYSGEDRLFVPTDQLNLLQKYIGPEEHPPKINKLGGGDWNRAKLRVKEALRDMADSLLELYAQREVTPGFAFSPDTVWQHEFEDSFIYEETPDQLKAIEDIKLDMEKPQPMDRLLCGDVGYGKTEVAMRAAFKAILDGKQVGVLVPTTILAQQHYQTFTSRMSGFPVTIKALSRFQSAKEQEEVVDKLLKGKVDLVVGTHRLLSTDVHFKNLGLLIIDEEQRFGVTHKEQIKKMRKNVDVLTMSATPIPRTLHMSLAGIRDMSLIETAPQGRFPIRTHVLEYNDEVIREALQREIDRKGQIYFVYNRVEGIEQMSEMLQELVPEARIIIGHGQMNEERLERVMLDFYEHKADILLCTTIIETGLDIPNVNTLIVYDADRFGLSQLYQLRGRVGRSNRIAHSYFCYRKDKVLSERAEKRLSAIRQFTELGSGFKIAMRDLEIRGAGNLLGAEQHGQIAAVGFDLYCRLLEETIREKRGEIIPELPEPVIELPIDAYISSEYIADHQQKVDIYKKIAAVQDEESADELMAELLDRFGDPPESVINLLNIAKIKIRAKMLGIASIAKENQEIVAKLHLGLTIEYEKILKVLEKYRSSIRYQATRPPMLKWKAATQKDLIGISKVVLDTLEILSK